MDVCEFMDVLIKSRVRQEVMGHIYRSFKKLQCVCRTLPQCEAIMSSSISGKMLYTRLLITLHVDNDQDPPLTT